MSAESHRGESGAEGFDALTHRARVMVLPVSVGAAVLTVLHGEGLGFAAGAAVLWLLAFFLMGMAASHEWDVCCLCEGPPQVVATVEARARLARRRHSGVRRWLTGVLILLVVLHAVLPKPYLGPWWARILAAVGYVLVAAAAARDMVSLSQHKRHHDECHVTWCRAGHSRPPGLSRRLRLSLWTGHQGLWLLALLAPAACALGLFALHHGLGARAAYGVALVLVGRVVGDMVMVHANEPCLYCARHVPSNGGELAERRSRWLRAHHVLRFWLVGASAAAWVMSWVLAGSAGGRVLVCAAVLTLIPWAVLDRVHGRLRVWCPWCRDGGGDEDREESPDPSRDQPAPV